MINLYKRKPIIVAEIGCNHKGNFNIAKQMIREAKQCGADYVKFQTFIPHKIASPKAKKAKYQIDENKDVLPVSKDVKDRLADLKREFKKTKKRSAKLGVRDKKR